MSFLAKWAEWSYSKRYSWISQAKIELCEYITHPFARGLILSNTGKQVNVAMYGKTKAGKTTLILELMHIRPNRYHELYTLLMCRKEEEVKGKSATPTAMMYSMIEGDKFYISCPSESKPLKKALSYQEAKIQLAQLRKDVESNQIDHHYEMLIEIPKEYFEDSPIELNIIDLPGVDSKNCYEREHTKKLINDFLPASNIVLIFCEGNQLSDLKDLFGDDEINPLADWKYFPDKYRIVTTSSYSAEEVSRQFALGKLNNADQVKEYYKQQIEQTLIGDNYCQINVYPLEYADSWNKLCANPQHSEYIGKIKEVNSVFFSLLTQDISAASSDVNQIAMLAGISTAMKKRCDDYRVNVKNAKEVMKTTKLDHENDIQQIKAIIKDLSKKKRDHDKTIKKLNFNIDTDEIMKPYSYKMRNTVSMENTIAEVFVVLKDRVSNYCKSLEELNHVSQSDHKHDINSSIRDCQQQIDEKGNQKIDSILEHAIDAVKMIKPIADYVRVESKKEKFAKACIIEAIANCNVFLRSFQEIIAQPILEKTINAVIKKNIVDIDGSISYYTLRLDKLLCRQESEITEQEEKIVLLKESLQQLNQDITSKSKINAVIMKVAYETIDQYCAEALNKNGSEALLYHMFAYQVAVDYHSANRYKKGNKKMEKYNETKAKQQLETLFESLFVKDINKTIADTKDQIIDKLDKQVFRFNEIINDELVDLVNIKIDKAIEDNKRKLEELIKAMVDEISKSIHDTVKKINTSSENSSQSSTQV